MRICARDFAVDLHPTFRVLWLLPQLRIPDYPLLVRPARAGDSPGHVNPEFDEVSVLELCRERRGELVGGLAAASAGPAASARAG